MRGWIVTDCVGYASAAASEPPDLTTQGYRRFRCRASGSLWDRALKSDAADAETPRLCLHETDHPHGGRMAEENPPDRLNTVDLITDNNRPLGLAPPGRAVESSAAGSEFLGLASACSGRCTHVAGTSRHPSGRLGWGGIHLYRFEVGAVAFGSPELAIASPAGDPERSPSAGGQRAPLHVRYRRLRAPRGAHQGLNSPPIRPSVLSASMAPIPVHRRTAADRRAIASAGARRSALRHGRTWPKSRTCIEA